MKLISITYRDIAWFAIVAIIVIYLSKCHRDELGTYQGKVVEIDKKMAIDSMMLERQRIQYNNRLSLAEQEIEGAKAKLKISDSQLTKSEILVSRLSIALKRAKDFPEDTATTLVSNEYIGYCDSLANTSSKLVSDLEDYKSKVLFISASKDSVISIKDLQLAKEQIFNKECKDQFNALSLLYKQVAKKPDHSQVFLGAELIGGPTTMVQNVGAVVSLKTKGNKLWQVSGGLQNTGAWYARLNGNILITFKK